MAKKSAAVNPKAYVIPLGSMFVMLTLTLVVSFFNKENMDTRSRASTSGVYPGFCPEYTCLDALPHCYGSYSMNCAVKYPDTDFASTCNLCDNGETCSLKTGLCVTPTPTLKPTITPTPTSVAPCAAGTTYCCHFDATSGLNYFWDKYSGTWDYQICDYGCSEVQYQAGCRCRYDPTGATYNNGSAICINNNAALVNCNDGQWSSALECYPSACTDTSYIDPMTGVLRHDASCAFSPTVTGTPRPTPTPTKASYVKIVSITGSESVNVSCVSECSKYKRPDGKVYGCVSIGTDLGGTNKKYYSSVNNKTKICTETLSASSLNGCFEVFDYIKTVIKCSGTKLPPESTNCRCQ